MTPSGFVVMDSLSLTAMAKSTVGRNLRDGIESIKEQRWARGF
jgi:hypothetical protein